MTVTEAPTARRAPSAAGDYALRVVIEARIAELWRWRAWYRARPDWASFMVTRSRHDTELRALVRLARQARAVAASQPDPLDVYRAGLDRGHGYHDVQAR